MCSVLSALLTDTVLTKGTNKRLYFHVIYEVYEMTHNGDACLSVIMFHPQNYSTDISYSLNLGGGGAHQRLPGEFE
jgi:hypothetical protein